MWGNLTIRENLLFIARLYSLDQRKARVERALSELGLTTRQHQQARELSGGWKQRMALAACMLHEPVLLFLDEPTAGVDPKARRVLANAASVIGQRDLNPGEHALYG